MLLDLVYLYDLWILSDIECIVTTNEISVQIKCLLLPMRTASGGEIGMQLELINIKQNS
jgi:hypothetical protein